MNTTDTTTQAATQLTRRAVWTVTAAATRPQPAVHVTPRQVAGSGGAAVSIGDDRHPVIFVEYANGWTVCVDGLPDADTLSARDAEKALVSGLEYCLAHNAH